MNLFISTEGFCLVNARIYSLIALDWSVNQNTDILLIQRGDSITLTEYYALYESMFSLLKECIHLDDTFPLISLAKCKVIHSLPLLICIYGNDPSD